MRNTEIHISSMKYLIDTNSISNTNLQKARRRNNLYILKETLDEKTPDEDKQKIKSYGVHIIDLSKKHLEKLKEVMTLHGDDFKLIRLYTNKGSADLVALAFLLVEKNKEGLFDEDYIFVTKDNPLAKVLRSYDIKCVENLD
jgi:tRNA G18 (ribose-2'-O)-methylase SpoU